MEDYKYNSYIESYSEINVKKRILSAYNKKELKKLEEEAIRKFKTGKQSYTINFNKPASKTP